MGLLKLTAQGLSSEELALPICKSLTRYSEDGKKTHVLCLADNGKPFLLWVDDGIDKVFAVCRGRGFSWFKFKVIKRSHRLYFTEDDELTRNGRVAAKVVSIKDLDTLVDRYFVYESKSTFHFQESAHRKPLEVIGTFEKPTNEALELVS